MILLRPMADGDIESGYAEPAGHSIASSHWFHAVSGCVFKWKDAQSYKNTRSASLQILCSKPCKGEHSL